MQTKRPAPWHHHTERVKISYLCSAVKGNTEALEDSPNYPIGIDNKTLLKSLGGRISSEMRGATWNLQKKRTKQNNTTKNRKKMDQIPHFKKGADLRSKQLDDQAKWLETSLNEFVRNCIRKRFFFALM